MPKRKLAALEKVDADLTNLQYKIRRDPKSYEAEFEAQYGQYLTQRDIFLANPSVTADNGASSFRELLEFVAQVSDCYKSQTKEFASQLISILSSHHEVLEPELREKIVGSLVIVRKKELIDSNTLLQSLFPILTTTTSKTLRALLLQKILSDLRNSNSKTTNHKLNRTVQTLLHNLVLADRSSPKALWAVKVTREMWKRQIWTDAKAVEIMKECALADNEKVIVGGVRFFLGGDKEREEHEGESDEDEEVEMAKLRHQIGINKKSKSGDSRLKKAAATVKRKEKKKGQAHPLNFSALHLLHNPQGFAEELFSKHLQGAKSKLNLEQKLQVLQLVSRLIGLHKLIIVPFYSYFLKFLKPKQPSVTTFLACLAQGTHSHVPPGDLETVIQTIANEFVSEAAAGEVAASGLNAIREICVRQPLCMSQTLLHDLIMYRKSKDKGVMMAAKGLLGLYRQVNPEMLKSRDRGKDAALGLRSGELKQQRYGEESISEIEGLDLLEKWKEEERQRRRIEKGLDPDASDIDTEDEDDGAGWDAWNIEEEDSDDSGGWINVESDDEINISDSDDEKPTPANKKVKFDLGQNEEHDTKAASEAPSTATNLSTAQSKLATTRILTPADLAKLQELRTTAAVSSQISGHHKHHANKAQLTHSQRHIDDALTADDISGLAHLSAGKLSRLEKIAKLAESKEEHSEHKSKAQRKKDRKQEQGKSTTNKEKARKKNFLMTLGKAKSKGKRSLVDHQKVLRMHVERGKRGGKRGNR
ncbi:Severe Depolymerization of Actin [Lithohypha guttulata]|nr:Severe Depolymerization of Actin [Lithohypha guttulata]